MRMQDYGNRISEVPYTGGITKLRQYFEQLYYTLVVFKHGNIKTPVITGASYFNNAKRCIVYLPLTLVSLSIVLISGST